MTSRFVPFLWLSLLAFLLQACGSMNQTADVVEIRKPGDRMLGDPQPVRPEAVKDLQFAWLSQEAYVNTPAGNDERNDEKNAAAENACPDPYAALKAMGWKVWPGFPDRDLQTDIDKFHLRVEVWTHQDPPEVAVAFGGTVINSHNDFVSNVRWFLPGHKDEYSETVQKFAPAFVAEYKRQLQSNDPDWAFLKKATVYSTGHSLGGGLAQQFAYAVPVDDAVPRVTHVLAFDPSPVTGYMSVDKETREANSKTLFIERIYERGEILAILRSITSFAVKPSTSDPVIRGVRYSLLPTHNPFSNHSIGELACKLHEIAKDKAE